MQHFVGALAVRDSVGPDSSLPPLSTVRPFDADSSATHVATPHERRAANSESVTRITRSSGHMTITRARRRELQSHAAARHRSCFT